MHLSFFGSLLGPSSSQGGQWYPLDKYHLKLLRFQWAVVYLVKRAIYPPFEQLRPCQLLRFVFYSHGMYDDYCKQQSDMFCLSIQKIYLLLKMTSWHCIFVNNILTSFSFLRMKINCKNFSVIFIKIKGHPCDSQSIHFPDMKFLFLGKCAQNDTVVPILTCFVDLYLSKMYGRVKFELERRVLH